MERAKALQMAAEDVLREWIEIARADPHQLSQYVREPCEGCWSATGDAHERGDEIDPDCAKCRGRAVIADTRSLTGPARNLLLTQSVAQPQVFKKLRYDAGPNPISNDGTPESKFDLRSIGYGWNGGV